MTKAYNRYKAAIHKRRVAKWLKGRLTDADDPARIGYRARTKADCSCSMCTEPSKYKREKEKAHEPSPDCE